MQHARHAALRDDDVVDSMAEEAPLLARRLHKARQQQAVLHVIVTVEDFLQSFLELIPLYVGHKAQRADVHAADRHRHLAVTAADT